MKPDTFYHIYNHANGREQLFIEERNYNFFLERYAKYINPIANTYAYNLLPNHIHFAIQVKGKIELEKYFGEVGKFDSITSKELKRSERIEYLLSKQFSNLFSSYSQSFNKLYKRKGSLFIPNVKKKEIASFIYFKNLIHYIHTNAVHHGFVRKVEDWPHSSYHAHLSDKYTLLKRSEVLMWFEGVSSFVDFHKLPLDRKMILEMDF